LLGGIDFVRISCSVRLDRSTSDIVADDGPPSSDPADPHDRRRREAIPYPFDTGSSADLAPLAPDATPAEGWLLLSKMIVGKLVCLPLPGKHRQDNRWRIVGKVRIPVAMDYGTTATPPLTGQEPEDYTRKGLLDALAGQTECSQ